MYVHAQVDVYEVVHGRDSVCVSVYDHVHADVVMDANANAPVYDLVDLHATVHVDVGRPQFGAACSSRSASFSTCRHSGSFGTAATARRYSRTASPMRPSRRMRSA